MWVWEGILLPFYRFWVIQGNFEESVPLFFSPLGVSVFFWSCFFLSLNLNPFWPWYFVHLPFVEKQLYQFRRFCVGFLRYPQEALPSDVHRVCAVSKRPTEQVGSGPDRGNVPLVGKGRNHSAWNVLECQLHVEKTSQVTEFFCQIQEGGTWETIQ